VSALDEYWATLAHQVVGVALSAALNRAPARYGDGEGSVRIGVNRREQLPDGTMVLGENPNAVVDPSVNVIRFDALDGRPIRATLSSRRRCPIASHAARFCTVGKGGRADAERSASSMSTML